MPFNMSSAIWFNLDQSKILSSGNAGNQYFLLSPLCFLPSHQQISIFKPHFFCPLQVLSIWISLKLFCRLVKNYAIGQFSALSKEPVYLMIWSLERQMDFIDQ